MFKSRFAVLLVVLLVAAMAAPMVQAQDQPVVIAPQACKEPGKLTMWVWDESWETIIGKSIDTWKAKYCPGAEVDLILSCG
jgi:ABC-type taurine transport system substrate-binding protein